MQLPFHYLLKAQSLRIVYVKCRMSGRAMQKYLCLIFLTEFRLKYQSVLLKGCFSLENHFNDIVIRLDAKEANAYDARRIGLSDRFELLL